MQRLIQIYQPEQINDFDSLTFPLFPIVSSSNNDDDIDNSIHSHTAPPYLLSPENKMFSMPGTLNFSMAALAGDPAAALAGM